MSDRREIAAFILRIAGGTASATSRFSPDPLVSSIGVGVAGLVDLVATLVEKVGVTKAEEVLAGVVGEPAKPLSDEDLDANVAKVRAELGLE